MGGEGEGGQSRRHMFESRQRPTFSINSSRGAVVPPNLLIHDYLRHPANDTRSPGRRRPTPTRKTTQSGCCVPDRRDHGWIGRSLGVSSRRPTSAAKSKKHLRLNRTIGNRCKADATLTSSRDTLGGCRKDSCLLIVRNATCSCTI